MTSLLFLFFALTSSLADPPVKVEWLTPATHDFGTLQTGVIAKVEFRFKNISPSPISIDNVRTSCGCTAADWQDEVILPDETGHILIEFEAKKPGYFNKKITAFFSGQRKAEKLYIEGYVE